ncbi:phospholipase A2-like [Helicoverpa zea]|uniref:phospholipase A2-like n=1 Tax=Helicoverpa zea TaxID=7113 RepID=UPI001F5A3C99|nr:phospholipase A2-like [Helicoverpa zea]
MLKVILLSCLLTVFFSSHSCWLINDVNIKMLVKSVRNNSTIEELEKLSVIVQKRFDLVYPGTKWCGPGDISDSYNDLGTEREADMCCRDHDKCPDFISGGETKYDLTNDGFYTRSSCKCDSQFLKCLRTANTMTATEVGIIYSNLPQAKCFKEDYPVTGCKKRGGFLNTKCLEYSYDNTGEKTYQWFDVPDF